MHPSAAGNRPSKLREPHNVSVFFHLILITNLDWKSATMSRLSEIFDEPSSLMYVCLRCHIYSCKISRHTIHDAHSREAYLHLNITVVWYTTPYSLAHTGQHFRKKNNASISFSKQLFKSRSPFEFLHYVVCFVCSDVSDEHTASIFRVDELV